MRILSCTLAAAFAVVLAVICTSAHATCRLTCVRKPNGCYESGTQCCAPGPLLPGLSPGGRPGGSCTTTTEPGCFAEGCQVLAMPTCKQTCQGTGGGCFSKCTRCCIPDGNCEPSVCLAVCLPRGCGSRPLRSRRKKRARKCWIKCRASPYSSYYTYYTKCLYCCHGSGRNRRCRYTNKCHKAVFWDSMCRYASR